MYSSPAVGSVLPAVVNHQQLRLSLASAPTTSISTLDNIDIMYLLSKTRRVNCKINSVGGDGNESDSKASEVFKSVT